MLYINETRLKIFGYVFYSYSWF